MNLGFIIALIYFVIIGFWFITACFYFIYLTKPFNILPGTTPQIYITIMKNIHDICMKAFGYLFVCVTIIIIILFIIWFILKSLPWPLNYMSEIPPLKELNEAGVFRLYENLLKIILSFSGPQTKFKQFIESITGFLKKFLIKFLEEYNPKLAEHLKSAPGTTLPLPEKTSEKPQNKKYNPNKILDKKIQDVIDKQIDVCIFKNNENITSDMTTSEILQKNMMNRFNVIQCKLLAIEPKIKINLTNKI
jgi:hypothetical protein